jgi:hypothetical protein
LASVNPHEGEFDGTAGAVTAGFDVVLAEAVGAVEFAAVVAADDGGGVAGDAERFVRLFLAASAIT